MTLDPGDETHRHGDYIPVESINSAVEPGMPVFYNSSGNVAAIDSGDGYLGVYYEHGRPQADNGTVKTQGTVKAYVQSGTSQGDKLGSPDTGATTPEDGSAFGTSDDQDVIALEDAEEDDDGNYVAEVLLR